MYRDVTPRRLQSGVLVLSYCDSTDTCTKFDFSSSSQKPWMTPYVVQAVDDTQPTQIRKFHTWLQVLHLLDTSLCDYVVCMSNHARVLPKSADLRTRLDTLGADLVISCGSNYTLQHECLRAVYDQLASTSQPRRYCNSDLFAGRPHAVRMLLTACIDAYMRGRWRTFPSDDASDIRDKAISTQPYTERAVFGGIVAMNLPPNHLGYKVHLDRDDVVFS